MADLSKHHPVENSVVGKALVELLEKANPAPPGENPCSAMYPQCPIAPGIEDQECHGLGRTVAEGLAWVIAVAGERPAGVPWTRVACLGHALPSARPSSWACSWPCELSPGTLSPPTAADISPSRSHAESRKATTPWQAAPPSSPLSCGSRVPPLSAATPPLPPWHCHARFAKPPSHSPARCTPAASHRN